MRAAVVPSVVLVLLAAGPAAAQSLQARMNAQMRAHELQAQQDLAARQMVILQNQLNTLEAQVRTEQAIAGVQAQSRALPIPPPPQNGVPRRIDPDQLAEIPDAALADSNARVKAAAENRR